MGGLEKMKSYKILIGFLILYFLIQLFLTQTYTLNPDEGTHTIISMFYKDLILNLKNFRSFNDIIKFAVNYAVKYPKITPIYPPLYHFLLTGTFLLSETLFLGRILNLLISLSAYFIIYKLAIELLDDEWIALLCAMFFLTFATIFEHAGALMMDILQILTFSLVLLYYLKIKKKSVVSLSDVIVLSLLLVIAFSAKFFSVFLLPIILIDSFFSRKKLFTYVLISVILSLIIFSPYLFFYVKFKVYKFFFRVATSEHQNKWVYFNVFSNFGIFIGLFVGISTILFLWKNRRNVFILIWFFLPLIVFMFFKDSSMRFAYILIPIYTLSCGFLMKKIYSIRSRQRRNLLLGIVFILLITQFVSNVFNNYHTFVYPVDELMGIIQKGGNVLILSEEPVYSSVYIFYGRINHVKGNIIRPCVLNENDLTYDFLEEWDVRYIVDQNNFIDDEVKDSLDLSLTEEKTSENYRLRLFETKIENKVDCNYICRLDGKVCKDQGIAGFLTLI